MTDQLSETRTDAEIIWECIYDHGNGKHKGEKSAAQRAEALAALERLKAQPTPQPAALPELLREIVAYCREAGHDWSNLAEAEHMLAALQSQPAASAIAEAIHYPDCWDQMAYPTLESALHELPAWFKCSNDECKQPAAAGVSDAACVPEKPLGKNWHAHYVLLDKAALQMIRNALRNDVERGLKVRGEMLDELDRAILALRPQAVPMTSKVAPKLIGWRSENFLWETDDIDKARNWAPNIGVLPIFEGDPNTKLGSRGTTAGGEKQA